MNSPRFLPPKISSMALLLVLAGLVGCADGDRTEQALVGQSGESPQAKPSEAPAGDPASGDPASGDAESGDAASGDAESAEGQEPGTKAPKEPFAPKMYTYEVIERFPHDRGAYTQGLLWHDGELYESTGQRGESSLRIVDLKTGEIQKKRDIDSRYFGEGLAAVNGLFYMLTWKAGEAFLFDIKTLRPLSYSYRYPGEGWGLTTCDEGLVMSDGTDRIRFLEPKGMKLIRTIQVIDRGRRIDQLNELEWIDGEIWANLWKSNFIARIDPATGRVNAWVDMSGLLGKERVAYPEEEVLNGIAWDAEGQRLFMTGKRWPYLYQIELREK